MTVLRVTPLSSALNAVGSARNITAAHASWGSSAWKFCNLKEKIQVSFGILVLGLVLFLPEQAKGDFFTLSFAPQMTEF